MKRKCLSALFVTLLALAASFFLSCRVVDSPLPQLKMPVVLSVLPNFVSHTSHVLLSSSSGTGVDIYYTLDLSTPDQTKLPWGSIFVGRDLSNTSQFLKMRTYSANYEPSDVKTVDLWTTYP